MKVFNYLFIAFLSINFTVKAQNKKAENSLLWEISGKDLKKPSYLFGTYHFAGKDFVDTMTVLNDKLKAADAVVGELIIDTALATKLVPYMIMNNNFLDKLLSPAEYQLVADQLKKVSNYDLKLFNSFKPAAIQVTLMQFMLPKTISTTNPPLDEYFQSYGKTNGKKVLGLETAEDQAALLFGNNLERQKELLLKSIKNEKKEAVESQKIYADYITQNLMAIDKTFSSSDSFTQEEWDALLKNRNLKWLGKLPSLMQNQSLFIAVGAGHLVGNDGLIRGLQALGYTVKPLATK